MIRTAFALVLMVAASVSALAQASHNTVAACLEDGYDIKAAFSDNSGGAYVVLQKGTSAYMCHSNPTPRCEKLN